MFGFIKTIGGAIFGGNEHAKKKLEMADTAIKGVGNWVDNLKYTEQEKATDLSNTVSAHLELIKATANENGARAITRRVMAWAITGFIMFWGSIMMLLSAIAPWLEEADIKKAQASVTNMISITEALHLGFAFGSIIVFYFGVQFFRARNK